MKTIEKILRLLEKHETTFTGLDVADALSELAEIKKKISARARYDAAIEKKSDYDKTLAALVCGANQQGECKMKTEELEKILKHLETYYAIAPGIDIPAARAELEAIKAAQPAQAKKPRKPRDPLLAHSIMKNMPREYRKQAAEYMRTKGLKVHLGGGRNGDYLTVEENSGTFTLDYGVSREKADAYCAEFGWVLEVEK